MKKSQNSTTATFHNQFEVIKTVVTLCGTHTEANKRSRAARRTFYSNSRISDSLKHLVGCLRETNHFAATNF